MTIVAAADGSALGNPGPAGWAWYVDDDCWRAGGWPHGTNNMGELMAVLDLFVSTAHMPEEPLHILCDSQYVINSVTKWMPGWKRKGWKKSDGKPVLNLELLREIDAALVGRKYTFEWVKGHAGHDLNEAADDRARAAATAYQAKRAPNAGPGFPGAKATANATDDDVTPAAPLRGTVAAPEPEQLDLFDAWADETAQDVPDPAYTPAADAGLEQIVSFEKELLDPVVRADATRLGLLLHPDFEEIGASGTVWSRDETITSMRSDLPSVTSLQVLALAAVGADAALLSYRSSDQRGSVLRSSLWQREDGQWRLRFHQGTPES
ncbi:RNase H family protein [Arthrobacter sp. TMN-49]